MKSSTFGGRKLTKSRAESVHNLVNSHFYRLVKNKQLRSLLNSHSSNLKGDL